MLAIEQPSPDLQLAIDQVEIGGTIILEDFAKPLEDLDVEEKDDRLRSAVSATDARIHNTMIGNIGKATGEKTMSEEYKLTRPELLQFLAPYGTPNAWCLDPLDGTKDYLEAIMLRLGLSVATVSLAKLVEGQPVLGALHSPLLGLPRLYAAETGKGVFVEVGGKRRPLAVDSSQNEGIILVSENWSPVIHRIAKAKGLMVLAMSGMALKMLCGLDQELIHTVAPRLPRNGGLCFRGDCQYWERSHSRRQFTTSPQPRLQTERAELSLLLLMEIQNFPSARANTALLL